MSRPFSFIPFDHTVPSSSSSSSSSSSVSSSAFAPADDARRYDLSALSLSPSSYRHVDLPSLPFSPTSSSSLQLAAEPHLYRGVTLHADDLTTDTEPFPSLSKELTLPSLYPSSSSSSSSFKVDLPSVSTLPLPRPLSPVPALFDRQFSFLSSSPPSALLSHFSSLVTSPSFLFSSSPAVVHPRHPSLSFTVHSPPSLVTLSINLFSFSAALTLIEVQRRSGPLPLFHSVYAHLLSLSTSHFTSFLSPPPTDLSSMSPPALSPSSSSSSSDLLSPLSMDDDDALDAHVHSLLHSQAVSADHHHQRQSALSALHQSHARLSMADVLHMWEGMRGLWGEEEKVMRLDVMLEGLAGVAMDAVGFGQVAREVSEELIKGQGSVWWRRGLLDVLLVCVESVEGKQALSTMSAALSRVTADNDEVLRQRLDELLSKLG